MQACRHYSIGEQAAAWQEMQALGKIEIKCLKHLSEVLANRAKVPHGVRDDSV
jgi:hypothetical protein